MILENKPRISIVHKNYIYPIPLWYVNTTTFLLEKSLSIFLLYIMDPRCLNNQTLYPTFKYIKNSI